MENVHSNPPSGDVFATTRWTQVLASHGDSEGARQALSDLCAAYYAPVVAFLRSEGRNDDVARELAHEFFAGVLERQSLGGADPERGRFRSYLLGALKHFLANRRVRETRDKRGGGAPHQPIEDEGEVSPGTTVASEFVTTPDRMFDREWALSILERTFRAMREDANRDGSLHEFEVLKPWLTADGAGRPQADAARELGLNDGAVRVAIHRLRRSFRERVKGEVARTVNHPDDIAGEMRHLIEALA